MDTERWRQLEDLFAEAASLPDSERDAFLLEAAKENAELADEVRALLAAEDDSGHLREFEQPEEQFSDDAMSLELEDFIAAIRNQSTPTVSGAQGPA